MEPFRKIKSIRVTKDATHYGIELTCPRCNHFNDRQIEITKGNILVMSEITWATPHVCSLDREVFKTEHAAIQEKSMLPHTAKSKYDKSKQQ